MATKTNGSFWLASTRSFDVLPQSLDVLRDFAVLENAPSPPVIGLRVHNFVEEQPAAPLLVGDLYDALQRDRAINKRKSRDGYRWEPHLKPFFASMPAKSVTAEQVESYIQQRQEEKAADATINRELAMLKRMYSLAIRARKLSLSERPYIPHLREFNIRQGFVRDQQYQALARETGKIGLWLRALFECGFIYGFRKGELLNLKVRQVDLGCQTITLAPADTKNSQPRIVFMTLKVFELLRECIAGKEHDDYVFTRPPWSGGASGALYREPGSKFWWIRLYEGHRVIRRSTRAEDKQMAEAVLRLVIRQRAFNSCKPVQSGRPRRVNYFRDDWRKATQAAGCPGLLFHDLRRTAVRNMIRAGVPTKTAMAISGHLTLSVFLRYNIVDDEELRDAAKKVAGRFPNDDTQELRRAAWPMEVVQECEQQNLFPEQARERKPPEAVGDAAAALARTIITDISDVKGAVQKPRLPSKRGRNPAVEQRRRERFGRVKELVNEGKSWEQIQALMNAATGKDLSEDAYRKLIQRAERKQRATGTDGSHSEQ